MARLRERYKQEVVAELRKRRGYTNVMQVPKVEKRSEEHTSELQSR